MVRRVRVVSTKDVTVTKGLASVPGGTDNETDEEGEKLVPGGGSGTHGEGSKTS